MKLPLGPFPSHCLALKSENLCTYQCKAGQGGGEAGYGGGDLTVFVSPRVGHLADLVLSGEGIFESLFARRGDILTANSDDKD